MSERRNQWHRRWPLGNRYDDWVFDRPRLHWIWKLSEPLRKGYEQLGCLIYGHVPVDDQCCKPEHRFCAWCHTPQPGKEPAW